MERYGKRFLKYDRIWKTLLQLQVDGSCDVTLDSIISADVTTPTAITLLPYTDSLLGVLNQRYLQSSYGKLFD